MKGNALFIVGSPRRRKSTSHVLATALSSRLHARGWECVEVFATATRPHGAELEKLLQAVDLADLVVVVYPLYVDQLPAAVIAALEAIHAAAGSRREKPRRLAGIVQCGFPESHHNDTSLAILRRFSEIDGFEWAGGLSRGMGGLVSCRSIEDAGHGPLGIAEAFDLAADALTDGEPIPEKAVELAARTPIPMWMYVFLGNLDWYRQAWPSLIFKLRDLPRV